jgi:hypothetical protein
MIDFGNLDTEDTILYSKDRPDIRGYSSNQFGDALKTTLITRDTVRTTLILEDTAGPTSARVGRNSSGNQPGSGGYI